MLALTSDVIEKRARNFIETLAGGPERSGIEATVIAGQSAVGGGSGPNTHPQTALVALKHPTLNADDIEGKLRLSTPPVIARIAEGLVLLDLRTVDEQDETVLLEALSSLRS
jgi:L-seryl-tRNA(Ser) seleniumtransferase